VAVILKIVASGLYLSIGLEFCTLDKDNEGTINVDVPLDIRRPLRAAKEVSLVKSVALSRKTELGLYELEGRIISV